MDATGIYPAAANGMHVSPALEQWSEENLCDYQIRGWPLLQGA